MILDTGQEQEAGKQISEASGHRARSVRGGCWAPALLCSRAQPPSREDSPSVQAPPLEGGPHVHRTDVFFSQNESYSISRRLLLVKETIVSKNFKMQEM